MAVIIKPPAELRLPEGKKSVFLAGSIEMGEAPPWQEEAQRALHDLDIVILNPRRDDWDSSWVQSIENDQFRGQVEWELAAQERASLIAMYFAATTKSPITLLELGLFARSGRLIVCCPEGFFRRGNVDIVCRRYNVPMAASLEDLVALVRRRLKGEI